MSSSYLNLFCIEDTYCIKHNSRTNFVSRPMYTLFILKIRVQVTVLKCETKGNDECDRKCDWVVQKCTTSERLRLCLK